MARDQNNADDLPAETIVLDDEAVMDTGEFRRLVAPDPEQFIDIEPPPDD